MIVQCPTCSQTVPDNQINANNRLGFCPSCNETFPLKKVKNVISVNENILRRPPQGAWFRRKGNKVLIGARLQASFAHFLSAIIGTVWTFYFFIKPQLTVEGFQPHLFFILIFIVINLLSWGGVLFYVQGNVEIIIDKGKSSVFTGVNTIGRTQHFRWSNIRHIDEVYIKPRKSAGRYYIDIVQETGARVRFGKGLNKECRHFILNALKYVQAEGY